MWYSIQNQQVRIKIIAKPNAKKTAIVKITELGLQIAIHAKPHKGAANVELIAFLANLLDVPKSQITIKSGENSKFKQIIMPLTSALQKTLEELSV